MMEIQKTFLNGGKTMTRNGKGLFGSFLGVIHFLACQVPGDIVKTIVKK